MTRTIALFLTATSALAGCAGPRQSLEITSDFWLGFNQVANAPLPLGMRCDDPPTPNGVLFAHNRGPLATVVSLDFRPEALDVSSDPMTPATLEVGGTLTIEISVLDTNGSSFLEVISDATHGSGYDRWTESFAPVTRGSADDDGDGAMVFFGCANADAVMDCDDFNPDVFPGAAEIADGVDNDCDGAVDEP